MRFFLYSISDTTYSLNLTIPSYYTAIYSLYVIYLFLCLTQLIIARYSHAGLFRAVVISICLLALHQPSIIKLKTSADPVDVFLDISESMNYSKLSEALSFVRTLGEENFRIFPFAGGVLKRSVPLNTLQESGYQYDMLNQDETRIEKALEQIILGNRDYHLLVSDGFNSKPIDDQLLLRLNREGKKIFPLISNETTAPIKTPRIKSFHVPYLSEPAATVKLSATLTQANSGDGKGYTLSIKDSTKTICQKNVLFESKQLQLQCKYKAPLEGIETITLLLLKDGVPVEQKKAYLSIKRKQKILLVERKELKDSYFQKIVKRIAPELEVTNPSGVADALKNSKNYSTIILNNISSVSLNVNNMKTIKQLVKKGTGFIMIGGNQSFGWGGYRNTPLEEIIPVKMKPRETVKKRVNKAIMLIIDKSVSMNRGNRLVFAKKAAEQIVQNLKDSDYLGVIGFDSTSFVVLPPKIMKGNRSHAVERLNRLYPSGSTRLTPALVKANELMVSVPAGRKHIIVLTDGRLDADTSFSLQSLANKIYRNEISISTVRLAGNSGSEMLRSVAENAGGTFYYASTPRELPNIFLKDIYVHTRETTRPDSKNFSVRIGKSGLTSVSSLRFPVVNGYVDTEFKPTAKNELSTGPIESPVPLLASMVYGKGKTIAYTTDTEGIWSRPWLQWKRIYQFWRELLASAAQGNAEKDDIDWDFRHYIENETLSFEVSFFNSSKDYSSMKAEVITPEEKKRTVTLIKEASGLFRGQIADKVSGTYSVNLYAEKQKLTPLKVRARFSNSGEKKNQGNNLEILKRIAEKTGGQINPNIERLIQENTHTEETAVRIFLYLISIGFALLCVELYKTYVKE